MQSWPATLMEFWSWHVEAACGAVDISLFYSPEGERGPRKARRERAAKEICARCKVAEVCAAFAVATIRRWWQMVGKVAYPDATRLLVTADAGGSNGYRSRLWKVELGKLAAETGLQVTVCHFPPGTSKWNRIEHRLFSQISMNWRGRPLVSHEVIVDLIGATTTRTGLRVRAELDRGAYPTGVKVSDAELAAVPLTRHDWHGEWNYTITGPRTRTTAA